MSDRKSRFNFFRFNKNKKENNSNWSDDSKKANLSDDVKGNDLSFPSFDSIIPENSPLKKNPNTNSGFLNDDLKSKGNVLNSDFDEDLDGVDEKYAKYIFANGSDDLHDFERDSDYKSYKDSKNFKDSKYSINFKDSKYSINFKDSKYSINFKDSKDPKDFEDRSFDMDNGLKSNEKLKGKLLNFKSGLLNKNNSSKTLFGKVTFILIFLVLVSSMFYFFVYQPFQNELNLERNSKLNEVNALYRGPLEINDNAYTLKNQINQAYDIEEIKSIDVLMFATKDWRMYHSSKIVSCKDDFGRVMMSYGENKNILMSVRDANDFVKDNDARILSNVQFEKVNTVIVPVSLSRLQATAGLISVGSVVDIYTLSDNSTVYDYMSVEGEEGKVEEGEVEEEEGEAVISNESGINDSSEKGGTMDDDNLESADEGPVVSGATVLAILRSKDSGIVDSAISRSNTIIKGNQTNPFENTSSYSSDVEEELKASVLNSNNDNDALDSYLMGYGVRLSNFERMSNLGDLDSEYIILLEVPQGDVNFVINNMDNVILTIPTDFAPNWVLGELNQTYYENLYPGQSLDFL